MTQNIMNEVLQSIRDAPRISKPLETRKDLLTTQCEGLIDKLLGNIKAYANFIAGMYTTKNDHGSYDSMANYHEIREDTENGFDIVRVNEETIGKVNVLYLNKRDSIENISMLLGASVNVSNLSAKTGSQIQVCNMSGCEVAQDYDAGYIDEGISNQLLGDTYKSEDFADKVIEEEIGAVPAWTYRTTLSMLATAEKMLRGEYAKITSEVTDLLDKYSPEDDCEESITL